MCIYSSLLIVSLLLTTGGTTVLPEQETILVDFSASALPAFVQLNNATVQGKATPEGLNIRFDQTDWPNIFFQAPEEGWDWSLYAGIGITLYNPGDTAVEAALRLDNKGADGMRFCNTLSASVESRQSLNFKMHFKREGEPTLWGMRGLPGTTQYGKGDPLDLSAITAFQLFLPKPVQSRVLRLNRLYLFGNKDHPAAPVPLPFVDRYGQYKHADWPGKLTSEANFKECSHLEEQVWSQLPELPERDTFGGWAAGPRLEATGWFRTAQVNDKWWLVTPEGSLFLSLGVDCVGTGDQTFVEKRDAWFEWLPPRDDPLFGDLFATLQGAHSMAEPIGGGGATFNFYAANLIRKYGADWRGMFLDSAYKRLRHWGFNTLGNWSQGDVLEKSPLPFVVPIHIAHVQPIEAATGYWGKMMDVYDPTFAANVESSIAGAGKRYGDNPLCIGYFTNNELAWEGVIKGVLASDDRQPARGALLQFLQERHGDLDTLNRSWSTSFASWESLCSPDEVTAAAREDLDAYLYRFARRYFSLIRAALKQHAPHHLYLGCRFSSRPAPVIKACAEIADVLSFNFYFPVIPADMYRDEKALDKPILVGEFHFGALDRGMFHTGLVGVENQAARADHYEAYVKSVVEHPAFVGCHWFKYADEPITGRWFDGENYNIGFVTVTDTPYPELVEAARKIHGEAYRLRYGGAYTPAR